ncbi:MAG: hypothetical protein CMK06_12365 [Ponticaulis sp.]|nr:hypothetical protein [Ponticaulis sp.]
MSPALLGLSGLFLVLTTAHEEAPRQAQAHTHGLGEAFVTLEGKDLAIQIAAPSANFVTKDGATADTDALTLTGEMIVSLPRSAKCDVTDISVESEAISTPDSEHEHADMDHDHADHDHHDADEDVHDQHEHEHEDDHAGHSNLLVSLEAQCDNPDKLNRVELKVFETWAGFDTLDTTFLTPEGVNTARLSSGNTKIERP